MTFSDLKLLNFYLRDLKEEIMSALSDKIEAVKASQDAAIARVIEDVAAQQAEIDELRTKVTNPEDLAALDAIQAKNDALDPIKPATLPDTEAEPFESGA